MRNAHSLTWNMAKTLKNMENEKCTLQDPEYGKKMKKLENVKCTLYDLKYGERH